ncbi:MULTISPECIES: DUF6471 domain-containing protein [unclassified Mesorhizobium]|uniref:DUF6471 domain-containing protein n=1 Tax=unclassified Mesorhizobium TaxID=325217 RepID=UPI0033393624
MADERQGAASAIAQSDDNAAVATLWHVRTTPVEYETRAKNLLKAVLPRKGVTCAQMTEKLATMDIHETERNLNNKISRGALVQRSWCNA